jgi:hypothetical protein
MQTDPAAAERWSVIGENLGWGTFGLATPRAMVEGWMESPTHRDNILFARYDEIGIGITEGAPVRGRSGALTYATVFGTVAPERATQRRRPACRRARRARTRAARIRAKRRCAARARAARAARSRS